MTKGDETRARILRHAAKVASRDGLEGLSIGELATALEMSKSGLFAHFGSKEDLQIEVLRAAAVDFEERVIRPALKQPRGAPRLRALFERWSKWASAPELPGGCIFAGASFELDDRPGPVRDYLVEEERRLLDVLSRSAQLGVESGLFRQDLDCDLLRLPDPRPDARLPPRAPAPPPAQRRGDGPAVVRAAARAGVAGALTFTRRTHGAGRGVRHVRK